MPDKAVCLDFVAVGHVTFDVKRRAGCEIDRPEPGGAAAYAAGTAIAMGLTAGIVTSSSPGYPFDTLLPLTKVVNVSAAATTTFEYSLHDGVRTQWLRSGAANLTRTDLPDSWSGAPSSCLDRLQMKCPATRPTGFPTTRLSAPCRKEAEIAGRVGQGSRLARRASRAGQAHRRGRDFKSGCACRSRRSVDGDVPHRCDHPRSPRRTRLRERTGPRHSPGHGNEVDATGAGDVWAAAFAIRLAETRDVTFAANFASAAAAISIEHRGMLGIPTRDEVTARMDAGPVGEDPAQRGGEPPSIDDLQGQRQLGLVHTKSTPSGGPGGHFSTPRCCPECPNFIPSEAEESKPVVGSRGTIHATRPGLRRVAPRQSGYGTRF